LEYADPDFTGLSSFVKEYVVARAIPIPELLCAFDVYLVGTSEASCVLPINASSQCEELQAKKPKTLVYFLQVILSGE
jgi:hypothetical protein